MPLQNKYRKSIILWITTSLLVICNTIYPQKQSGKEKVLIPVPGAFIHINDSIYFSPGASLSQEASSLVPAKITEDKLNLFLDSLKVKASKNLITKKLYDFIVVSDKQVSTKQITATSDISFLKYSGKKIRKIKIIRLNAFGTNVNSPLYYEPNKVETLLNKTHIKTNESIIKKSLLFSEGDTISPLVLSDNERILRKLPFIDDSRIILLPDADGDVDVVVITKDLYSLGGDYTYRGIHEGSLSLFEKNVLGMGHGLELEVPYDTKVTHSLGFGIYYTVNNISKSFINMNLNYYNALGDLHYGFKLSRDLISANTKYAGGISIIHMSTTEDLNSLIVPEPLKYNLQDYWLLRSFSYK